MADLTKLFVTLRREGLVEDSRANELVRRYERVIPSSNDLTKSQYAQMIFGDGDTRSPFVLNRQDKRRIRSVMERLRIRLAQERPIDEDIDKLDEIITSVEER